MTNEPDGPLWVWQGFFGPIDAAQEAYDNVELSADLGVLVPSAGGPISVDTGGRMGMFAVQTRPAAPIPTPAGMIQADPAMVGRLVGA